MKPVLAITILAVTGSIWFAGAWGKYRAIENDSSVVLARAVIDLEPAQTCLDGSLSADGCKDTAVQLARGAECPAASGAYCSDEFPYCCGTPGNYYCAKDVNSC